MRLTLPLLLALAACSAQTDRNVTAPDNAVAPGNDPAALPDEPRAVPTAAATPSGPAMPANEAPMAQDGAQGAAKVVQKYYALLEAGKYSQAYRLWEPGAAGMTPDAFAASFGRYAEYHAKVGTPGRVDSGAGQRYVTVPVEVFGTLRPDTRPFNMRGSIVLHRTAEIDGATPEQRSWRIRSADITPRSGEAAPTPQPGEDNRSTARYRCMDGSRLVARFDPERDRVTVVRGGKALATLQGERVASGIRYTARGYELRGKGSDMTFTAPGLPPIACTVIR
ncbi:MliC family protein [Sphingomonas sp. HF-S4]|uniref:MliC family protein n=1 Tax=Sphingomonas agrestis TaxID=3080540 RepID=A0ABU3Y8Q4_9SPHN|nr:MliC family protein [Sphingomonas sp. HF-S4]MDV3457776.1 MliC family protein [Sphingomonas sp. HF-S4]